METNKNKNLVDKYVLDIRNMKKLDQERLNTISTMSTQDIMQIIIAYNEMIAFFRDFVDVLK